MRVWIDAAPAAVRLTVLGMTPVERHIRAARRAGIAASDIVVDGGGGADHDIRALLGSTGQNFPVRVTSATGDIVQRLRSTIGDDQPVIVLAGDCVADPRLLDQLAGEAETVVVTDELSVNRTLPRVFARIYGDWTEAGDGRTCVLRIRPGSVLPSAATVAELGARLLEARSAGHFDSSGRDKHLAMQRRDVPFWIRRVADPATRDGIERFLFDASYKGSTDLLTQYVLPFVVWPLVLLCTRFRIHPNSVTAVSVLATFAAIPFFMLGWWASGLALAWLMSVLDSVDGKVARLTMTDSKIGEVLDHGLDIVHPPIWYFGWAMGLSGLPLAALWDGRMLGVPVFQAAILLLVLYVADRLVLAIYKHRFRRGLHSHGRIDAVVRGIISRRNINLALFTIALVVGWGVAAFYLVVAWQLATLLWHAGRTAWIFGRGESPPVPT